jgi:hypothetical protein
MIKIRLAILSSTIIFVGVIGWLLFLYAKGYRVDTDKLQIEPNGLLVIKSVPDGAQIYIDGELETATNATIPLAPGTYDIILKKEGFFEWEKRLNIDKEIVTETTAHLFKVAPSLSAATFNGVYNPLPSYDMTKIAYVVPTKKNDDIHNEDQAGLWIMEIVDLPLGFSRDPRRITNGSLVNTTYEWSIDNREILLTTQKGTYLLDSSKYTPQNQLINELSNNSELLSKWNKEKKQKLDSQIRSLPKELIDILSRKTHSLSFSPDKDMILYTASSSAKLSENLIKSVPGASTQKQNRDIIVNHTYIYDVKEDRNFLIDSDSSNLFVQNDKPNHELTDIINPTRRISWFPTSRHLLLAEKDKVTIMDYDGTNREEVYKGSFITPYVFPTLSSGRILILTNLGADDTSANLYSLSIK